MDERKMASRAEMAETKEYLRFSDLKALGIVSNWTTLMRWIRQHGFPAGTKIGPATRIWRRRDIEDWLARRERAGGVHAR